MNGVGVGCRRGDARARTRVVGPRGRDHSVGTTTTPAEGRRQAAAAEEEVPASVDGLSSKSQEYTYSEFLNVLTGSEWVVSDELGSL